MCDETTETRTATRHQYEPFRMPCVGDKIGRFLLVAELGAGGMGRVFEAHDSELDRQVALKMLRRPTLEGRRQLLLEGQALARLRHPNVVTVHDVGVDGGMLFIAMEYVGGGTLKEWAASNPVGSSARFEAALAMLIDAGTGLVAAHEAGLVHRDVKPSNILVGDDGRARVADFGIARAFAANSQRELDMTGSEPVMVPESGATSSSHRQEGTGAGTPPYMAPEQLSAGVVGIAADQFSFCVTAWELLYGERPFPGSGVRARLYAIRRGPRLPAPGGNDEVRRLIERGLRYRASARYKGLDELVEALRAWADGTLPPRARRTWWLPAGLVAASTVAIGVHWLARTEQRCTGAGAAFRDVWGDKQRAQARTAILASGQNFALGSWFRFEQGLDEYSDVWRTAYNEACEASQIREEATPEEMAERLACLEVAKRSAKALVSQISSGDAGAIANEHDLVAALPVIEECANIRGVPTSTELSMLDSAAVAGVHRRGGELRLALERIEPVVAQIDSGTTPFVAARVLLEHGQVLSDVSDRRAIQTLNQAYRLARSARQMGLAAEVARALAWRHEALQDSDSVRRWIEAARTRRTNASTSERCELLALEGSLLALEGDNEAATLRFEQSVDVARNKPALLPGALRILAEHLAERSPERAVNIAQQALEQHQARFGTSHPGVAVFEDTLAGLLERVGETTKAQSLALRAWERAASVWGEGHVATGRYLVRQAETRCRHSMDREDGKRFAERALQMYGDGEFSLARYRALSALHECVRMDDPSGAVAVAKQRLDASLVLFGEEHLRTVHARAMFAAALLQTSDIEGARKQVSLATVVVDGFGRGGSTRLALEMHRVSAGVAGLVDRDSFAAQHAEAALNLERRGALSSTLQTSDSCSAHRFLRHHDLDERICLEAAEVARALGQKGRVAHLGLETGRVMSEAGLYLEARVHLRSALDLSKIAFGSDSYYTALIQLELGRTAEKLGRYSEAEEYFIQSRELFAQFRGTRRLFVVAARRAAVMAARLGRASEALAQLDDLAEFGKSRSSPDPAHVAHLSRDRGIVLNLLDRRLGKREYVRALKYYLFVGDEALIEETCRNSPFEGLDCSARSGRRTSKSGGGSE